MSTELTFRIILGLVFLAFIANRAATTRKRTQDPDNVIVEREDETVPALANLLSLAGLLSLIAYLANPAWMAWAALPLPVWLRWAGLGVALLGFGVLYWAQRWLANNWSDKPMIVQQQTVTTGGPYRWVRHPIYTAFMLILSAPLLLAANWFLGLVWMGMTYLEVSARISVEEDMLLEHFGDEYAEYMKTTGRLLPKLSAK